MPDSRRPGKRNPTGEFVEIELVTALRHFDVNQLNSRTLLPDLRIERRSEHRSQHHVDAMVHGVAQKRFDQIPVLFAEHLHAVIACQTVGMKPFCMDQLLRRQSCGEDFQFQRFRPDSSVLFCFELQRNFAFPEICFCGNAHGDPQGTPEVLRNDERSRQIAENIGHQPRLFEQGIGIPFRPPETAHGNAFHGADLNIAQPGNMFEGKDFISEVRPVGDLERENFAAQHRRGIQSHSLRRSRALHDFDERAV